MTVSRLRMKGKQIKMVSKAGFFTLLALLLVMFIIALIYHVIVKVYLNRPSVDQQTKELFPQQNFNTPNYQSTLDRTRKTIQGFNKPMLKDGEER